MNPDFDVIIIGSGPAGVSSAFPLVESGARVLLVDGGRQADISPPDNPFLSARAEDPNQSEWMIGKDFYALQQRQHSSPKIRIPTHSFVFEGFNKANAISAKDFFSVGSLAVGGLSNAWGCGVAKYSGPELNDFPFYSSDLEKSYQIVSERVGISGRSSDDMADFFGVDSWATLPVPLDALHSYLFARYSKKFLLKKDPNFRLGRSRVAVLSRDQGGRLGCNLLGNCMWGCSRQSLYSAAHDLVVLRRYSNFNVMHGFIVNRISKKENLWTVKGQDGDLRNGKMITARKLVLAAGTLATTRIAFRALRFSKPAKLLTCPTAAFLIWIPRFLGEPRTDGFGFGQLSFSLSLRENIGAFGSTFSTTAISMTEFIPHLPFGCRYGIDVLRAMLSSCLVGNLFLPGSLSTATVKLEADNSLAVIGGIDAIVPTIMKEAAGILRKVFRAIGGVVVPGSFTLGSSGKDIHYSGTLPMRKYPSLGETNSTGEVVGLKGVYAVDGAVLPTLSEKSHTLTIMANADRIAREIVARKGR